MKAFLLATLFTLGLGGQVWANSPADLERNLVSNDIMDTLVAQERQETQLARRGDRYRGSYRGYDRRRGHYRGGYYGYRQYPRHGYYPRHRHYGPKYRHRQHHRHYRW